MNLQIKEKYKNFRINKRYFLVLVIAVTLLISAGSTYGLSKQSEYKDSTANQITNLEDKEAQEKGEVAGVQEKNEIDKTVTTRTTTSVPTSIPVVSPTATPIQSNPPVTNNTNNYYQAPTTAPVATTAPVDYSEALRQAQEEQAENARKQEQCTQWANERDATLAPLKQEADSAYQRYQNEMAAIDANPQLSAPQKEVRKAAVMPALLEAYYSANQKYQDAFNAYGSCPYN